jgi:hypothetical protein
MWYTSKIRNHMRIKNEEKTSNRYTGERENYSTILVLFEI